MELEQIKGLILSLVTQRGVRLKGNSTLVLDDIGYHRSNNFNKFELKIEDFCKRGKIAGYFMLEDSERQTLLEDTFNDLIILAKAEKETISEEPSLIQIAADWNKQFRGVDFNEFIPFFNYRTGEELVYSRISRQIGVIHFQVISKKLSDRERYEVRKAMPMALLDYNPYTNDYIYDVTLPEGIVSCLNTYKPPIWRLSDKTISNLPKSIKRFLERIFPKVKDREYVLDWLHHMLVSRSETYLVLNGEKGIGKGIFSDLITELVGADNTAKAPKSFPESNFTGYMLEKRLLIINETKITAENHNQLKLFIEAEQSIEAKFKEAQKFPIYCSYMITSNYAKNMYLEEDDRRFSIVDLSVTTLFTDNTPEQIDEWVKEMRKPESILAFGQYLLQRKPKYSTHQCYKGSRFKQLVKASQSSWQKFLVKVIKSKEKEEYSLVSLRSMYEASTGLKFNAQEDAISDFLKNNEKVRGEPIGYLVEDVEDPLTIYLVPHQDYMPTHNTEALEQGLS